MVLVFKEETYGSKAQLINDLMERLTSIDWYARAGEKDKALEAHVHQFMDTIGVSEYEVKWISKEAIAEEIDKLTFEGSQLWEVLKDLPDKLKKIIDDIDQCSLLESTIDIVPEAVFHGAFEGAFKYVGDEKAIQFLVGNAMYLGVMTCTATLAGKETLFEPLLKFIESGHILLGPKGNTIYLV